MVDVHASICRNCLAFCPILVTVEDGRATKVIGDPSGTPYEGYICPKGRALPEQHNDPARLLSSQIRQADGQFSPIASREAITQIAKKLQDIVSRYGPDAVALYIGTGQVANPTGHMIASSFFRALNSRMIFSASTIDKPGANTSTALHGNWVAGGQRFEVADTWMIVGGNPVIAKSNGLPYNNPGQRLKEAVRRGMKLIVIDPRKTETARRAHVHLQPLPGQDSVLLAGIIRIIIDEGLCDRDFVAQNARGFDELKKVVAPFGPEYVAKRAGVPLEDLREAALTFGRGKIGGVVCSTGPSFARHGDLTFYLALCLNTICGRWAREGMRATYQNILLPPFVPKAQPYPPYPVFGNLDMRARGLKQNASGLPTAALADEILLDGPRQIKALFCLGGNPMLAFPDQKKTQAALEKLELFVVSDFKMTVTAELADFVLAPPLTLEIPGATNMVEWLKYIGVSRGFEMPWAQYAGKVADPPPGADLIDEGEFFFRLAQEFGLQLEFVVDSGYGPHVESPQSRTTFDMSKVPTVDDLLELWCRDARVPLSEVKKYPSGHLFDEINVLVEPRDPDCTAKLELADPMMMRELAEVRDEDRQKNGASDFPFALICRRSNTFMNSFGPRFPTLNKGKPYNPVCIHPLDMQTLALDEGHVVWIRSSIGEIAAIAESDTSLRPGTISMVHGFGRRPDDTGDPRATGSSVSALIGMDDHDPISGMPQFSGVPVAIRKAEPALLN